MPKCCPTSSAAGWYRRVARGNLASRCGAWPSTGGSPAGTWPRDAARGLHERRGTPRHGRSRTRLCACALRHGRHSGPVGRGLHEAAGPERNSGNGGIVKMITYEKAHLRVAEFFLDEQESRTAADIVRYQFRSDPVQGCQSSDFHTLCLDLRCDADTILSKIHRETRYEIRRASKDSFTCEY